MKLLTKELLKEFEKQGHTQSKELKDIKIIVKYFNPLGAGSWYAVEYDAEHRIFFGYANIGDMRNAELGYFSLDDLENCKGPLGVGIERDLYFGEHTLQEIMDKKGTI